MTYVVCNTRYEGKRWAKSHLDEEEHKLLYTIKQIEATRLILHSNCVYVITNDSAKLVALMDVMIGGSIYSSNKWMSGDWKKK